MGNSAWDKNFHALQQFITQNGHSDVPFRGELRYLAKWCSRLKNPRAKTTARPFHFLTPQRKKALDDLGFDWSTKREKEDSAWEAMRGRLAAYKEEHGDCNVPLVYGGGVMGVWVSNQRKRHKRHKLREDRVEALEEMGFDWGRDIVRTKNNSGAYDDRWVAMFDQLVEYKKRNGDCDVPYNHEDWRLAMWVSTQRRVLKKTTFMYGRDKEMRKDRIEKLYGIGFRFELKERAKAGVEGEEGKWVWGLDDEAKDGHDCLISI